MKKRWLSFLLVFVMLAAAMPLLPVFAVEPVLPANDGIDFAALAAEDSYVYYGMYRHPLAMRSADGALNTTNYMAGTLPEGCFEAEPTPILWQVMGEEQDADGNGDGRLGLLSKYTLHSMAMGGTPKKANYADSAVGDWLNGEFLNSFTAAEQAAIPDSTVKTGVWVATANGDGTFAYEQQTGEYAGITWPTTVTQKVYLPWGIWLGGQLQDEKSVYWSADQVIGRNLIVSDRTEASSLQTSALKGQDTQWYRNTLQLRSPRDSSIDHILTIQSNGVLTQIYAGVTAEDADHPIRPVTKLLPENIVFVSPVSDTPATSYYTQTTEEMPAGTDDAAHNKLTVLNTELSMSIQEADAVSVSSGEALPIHVTSASNTGAGYSVGYKIVQEQDGVRRIVGGGQTAVDTLQAGENTVSIPVQDKDGMFLSEGSYTLHVWLQKNGDASNEASQPVSLSLTVNEAPPLTEYTTEPWQSAAYPNGTGQDDTLQFVSNVQTLPQTMTVSKLTLTHDASKIMSFQISVSEDNVNFTPVTELYPGGTEKYSGRQVYRFAPVNVRYIKYSAILLGTEETQASVTGIRVSAPATTAFAFVNVPSVVNPVDTDEIVLETRMTDAEGETYPANREAVRYILAEPVEGVSVEGKTLYITADAPAGEAVIQAEDLAGGVTARHTVQIRPQAAVHNLSFYSDAACETPLTAFSGGETVYAGAQVYADAASAGQSISVWAAVYDVDETALAVTLTQAELTDARDGQTVTAALTLPEELPEGSQLRAGIWDSGLHPLTDGQVCITSGGAAGDVPVQGLYLGINDSFPLAYGGAAVTYESDNPAVAAVDAAGLVQSVGEGWANILVKSGDTIAARIPVRVKAGMYVYLQMGQSNATGTNHATYMPEVDLTISDGVYILNNDNAFEPAEHRYTRYTQVTNGAGHSSASSLITPRSGISMSYMFGERFVEAHRLTDFGLVGNTLSGCRLEVFEKDSVDPGANGFENSVARVKAAVDGKDALLKGIIWHQGESNGPSADYTWHLRNMVYDFRAAFGDMELPFLAGGLSTDRSYLPEDEQEASAASARLFNSNLKNMEAELANFGYVDSEGLKLRRTEEPASDDPADGFVQDTSHFSAKAQVEFGGRYYDKYLEITQ